MSVGIYSAHRPSDPDCHYLFSHLSALLWRSAKERNALAKITLARKIIIIINLNTIIATITSIIVIIIAAINTNTIIVIIAIIIITPIASFTRKIVDNFFNFQYFIEHLKFKRMGLKALKLIESLLPRKLTECTSNYEYQSSRSHKN